MWAHGIWKYEVLGVKISINVGSYIDLLTPTITCTQVLWCLARLTRSRGSVVTVRPDTRLTIISTLTTQCIRGVQIPPFQCFVSHYTDTHLHVFSLVLALPVIINKRYPSSVRTRGETCVCVCPRGVYKLSCLGIPFTRSIQCVRDFHLLKLYLLVSHYTDTPFIYSHWISFYP